MRIFVALEVTHEDGKKLLGDTLLEVIEDEMADSVESGDSLYAVKVIGIGKTMAGMENSRQLRRGAM